MSTIPSVVWGRRRLQKKRRSSKTRTVRTGSNRAKAPSKRNPVLIDLALQGGGSHGAFTWGVLDRLLEEERLRFDGISGTSSGAMNAVVMADGPTEGGPERAIAALEDFESRVGSESVQPSPPRSDRVLTGLTLATRLCSLRLIGIARFSPRRPGGTIRCASSR